MQVVVVVDGGGDYGYIAVYRDGDSGVLGDGGGDIGHN